MRAIRAAAIAAACLAAVACFEEPREHLHLTLLGDQAVVVTAVQDVAGPEVAESTRSLPSASTTRAAP